jgi:hypothetical protein
MGLGAAMPLMNIAIQNEFDQKDLGAATSSNQLFRSLGSTIGVAVFGSMLTLGITSALGDMNNDPYIQTLKQAPAAQQMIKNPNDANTILNVNMPSVKTKINDGFTQSLTNVALPTVAKQALQKDFSDKQDQYGKKVVNAFSTSLHTIFIVASGMMAMAFVLALSLKERPLRVASSTETPAMH